MSDATIILIVSGVIQVITIAAAFFTLWIKLRYGVAKSEETLAKTLTVESKIDHNTRITRAGTDAAAATARSAADVAATVASGAESAVEGINRKLNGGIESAIASAVAPVAVSLKEHCESCDHNMAEIRNMLDDLNRKIKAR